MILKELYVKNFRNIDEASFIFHPLVNIFTGNNAQGKTNLMEAISLCLGGSFRQSKATEFIPIGKTDDKTTISLKFTFDAFPEKENIIEYEQKGSTVKVTLNKLSVKNAAQLYGKLRYVVFVPEDLFIVKGNPEQRRAYIDGVADMMNKIHHAKLMEYNKALRQKNNLLAKLNAPVSDYDRTMLSTWNESLARLGVNVMYGRLKHFYTLREYLYNIYSKLNQNNEQLTAEYFSTVMNTADFDYSDTDFLYKRYFEELENSLDKELIFRYTVTGAHRDDIAFSINGMNSRDFASQGQVRSIALALKLAEAEMIRDRTGDSPVVILDDVLSELDEYRRNFVINSITGRQVFITGCNVNDMRSFSSGKMWNVAKGCFTESK